VKALVFDIEPDSRSFWQNMANELAVEMHCSGGHPAEIQDNATEAKVVIIDQSVIGPSLQAGLDLCVKFPKEILVFTGRDLSIPVTVQLMSHGATWVFRKQLESEVVRYAFPSILESANKLAVALQEHNRLQAIFRHISAREKSVLDMVLNGVPNKRIAEELHVSVRTVEARRAKIYRKCEVQSVTELVRRVDHAQELIRRFGELKSEFSGKSGRRRIASAAFQPSMRAS
jgi:FixJ family two-component response regulator